MFRNSDYKIVRLNGEEWELYNIKDDPTELDNLATTLPNKLDAISKYYLEVESKLLRTETEINQIIK